jgi:hypothetical protein
MHPWAQVLLVLCAVVLTVVLVPAIVALRRAGERSERLLAVAEQELGPLLGQLQSLVDELRMFSKEARSEFARMGELTERIHDLTDGVNRTLSGLAGLTRVGQLVGLAAGLKTGLDVFLHRLRKPPGDNP